MCNKVIFFSILFLTLSCVNKPIQTNKKISVYDGSMSIAVACIFSPKDCDKVVEEKEWEEVDKTLDK
jgi:hypothetical protein